jgi:hypothetical protein
MSFDDNKRIHPKEIIKSYAFINFFTFFGIGECSEGVVKVG